MAKSIKFNDNIYLGSSSIIHNKKKLSNILNKDIITCTLPDINPQLIESWSLFTITNYTKYNQLLNNFTVNNGIKIPKGITKIKISAMLRLANLTGSMSSTVFSILKNGTNIETTYIDTDTNYFVTHTLSDILISVAENDLIQVGLTVGIKGNYRIYSGYITVEEV